MEDCLLRLGGGGDLLSLGLLLSLLRGGVSSLTRDLTLLGGVEDLLLLLGGVTVGDLLLDRDSDRVGVRDLDLPRGGSARRRGGGEGDGERLRGGVSDLCLL